MDALMVEVAQRHCLVEIGAPSARPGLAVVELTPAKRPLTSIGRAGGVVGGQSGALCLGMEIEQCGHGTEYNRTQVRVQRSE